MLKFWFNEMGTATKNFIKYIAPNKKWHPGQQKKLLHKEVNKTNSVIDLKKETVELRYDHDFGGSTRSGHDTKIHNSVIRLNWIMFDSKIIIYVKLCVY